MQLDTRISYNGSKLTFRPHIGIKSGWINQSIESKSIDTIANKEMLSFYTTKSWLLGPRIGNDSNWNIGSGFRFFGNAAASLVYQKFYKIKSTVLSVSNPALLTEGSYDTTLSQAAPILEGILGLGYGTYFDRNNWYFDLAIGYEIQYFFSQNQIASVKGSSSGQNINFMFHGLNITMKFDF